MRLPQTEVSCHTRACAVPTKSKKVLEKGLGSGAFARCGWCAGAGDHVA
jgi:hypothetical protein